MNKVVSRLLIFFIGIPAVLGLVFLKAYNHLALHIAICIASFLASYELYDIFSKKIKLAPKPLVIFCSVIIPVVAAISCVLPAFVNVSFFNNQEIITYAFIFSFLLILAYEVLTAKSFEDSNARLAGSVFIVLYSGYLVTFISRMTVFSKVLVNNESVKIAQDVSIPFICLFLFMVFICDSLAWFFGMLFGKNNRGYIKASPNKSIAGFVGGTVGSILSGVLGYFIWPDVFSGSIIKVIVLGLLIALSAIIGDLVESIFKRSADCKDSGHIIPGRGGLLDSVDSILMAAPVYYLLVSLMYGPLV